MKNVLLPLVILCCTLTTAFSQDFGRKGDNRRDTGRGEIRDLRECLVRNDLLSRDNQSLMDKLFNCRADQGDRGAREKLDRVLRENDDLLLRNKALFAQVENLKIENARLELEAHPDRGGRFNLSASILACGKIQSDLYSQQCIAAAKANSIQANVIDQCARISSSYYALLCVKTAGEKETSARQITACLGIDSDLYTQQCIQVSGEKRISAELINSCVKSTTSSYYRLSCVLSM
jgi:hypothetical protein